MDHKLVDGRRVAREINERSAGEIKALAERGLESRLVSITIGDFGPIAVYMRNQKRVAGKVGVVFEERDYAADITEAAMLSVIAARGQREHYEREFGRTDLTLD